MKVSDEAGNTSMLSNVASTDATDKTPPAPIMDLSAETGASEGALSLDWTAPGDDGNLGMVSAYLIKYSKEYLSDVNWDVAATHNEFVPPLPPGQLQSVIITGLEAGVEYYIGVKAYDDNANYSEISNIVVCTAGVDLTLAVNDEIPESVSPGSGSALHSSRPLLTVQNISAPGENVYYFEVSSDSFFFDIAAASPAVAQQEGGVTGWRVGEILPSNMMYYWRARANDFDYGEIQSFSVNSQPHVYPNPYHANIHDNVTFVDIPEGADVLLTTVSGSTVRQWSNVMNSELTWNGTGASGDRVASGTYLWFAGGEASGKIVVLQ
jgi:hypothetical protein